MTTRRRALSRPRRVENGQDKVLFLKVQGDNLLLYRYPEDVPEPSHSNLLEIENCGGPRETRQYREGYKDRQVYGSKDSETEPSEDQSKKPGHVKPEPGP